MMASGELRGFDPQRTFDEAALDYIEACKRYWSFCPTRTIELAELKTGQRVLDTACGPGLSTIAAAQLVGPTGEVIGVDFSRAMLDIAEAEAKHLSLGNVEFREADFTQLELDLPPESFDAVLCSLGIFFADDMIRTAASLWELVRPGGRLIITTFGNKVLEPMLTTFVQSVKQLRPEIDVVLPWQRAAEDGTMSRILNDAGVSNVEMIQESHNAALEDPSHWWIAVMGSSLRRPANMLGDDAIKVREQCEDWAREHNVTSLECVVNFAICRK